MSKHTPGPWSHATDFGQVGSIETDDGLVIAQAQALVSDPDRSVRNANARLIAAAPDLLEALYNMLEDGDKTDREQALAAIKRATS